MRKKTAWALGATAFLSLAIGFSCLNNDVQFTVAEEDGEFYSSVNLLSDELSTFENATLGELPAPWYNQGAAFSGGSIVEYEGGKAMRLSRSSGVANDHRAIVYLKLTELDKTPTVGNMVTWSFDIKFDYDFTAYGQDEIDSGFLTWMLGGSAGNKVFFANQELTLGDMKGDPILEYTPLENGWVNMSVSYTWLEAFSANDSIRIEARVRPIADKSYTGEDAVYIDNVKLTEWTAQAPTTALKTKKVSARGVVSFVTGASSVAVVKKGEVTLTENDYAIENGIITFKKEFTDSLAGGTHEISVEYGSVIEKFNICKPYALSDYNSETKVVVDFEDKAIENGATESADITPFANQGSAYSEGRIVDVNGNKVLKLSLTANDTNNKLSVVYALWSELGYKPASGELITYSFDFKMDYADMSGYTDMTKFYFNFIGRGTVNTVYFADQNLLAGNQMGNPYVAYTTLKNGWTRASVTCRVTDAIENMDSIRLYAKTNAATDAVYFDNITIQKYTEKIETFPPVINGKAIQLVTDVSAELVFEIDAQGLEVTSVTTMGTELEAADYTFVDNTFTLKADFIKTLSVGINSVIFATKDGEVELKVIVFPNEEDVALVNLLLEDFEKENVGARADDASAEKTLKWSTNPGFDSGDVVESNGNKYMRVGDLPDDAGKGRAIVFTYTPTGYEIGDVLTVSFDYKLNVADWSAYADAELETYVTKPFYTMFVSSEGQFNIIYFEENMADTVEKGNSINWAISYTQKEDGWVHVSYDMMVDYNFLKTNSIRFRAPSIVEGDYLYFDNVRIDRWTDNSALPPQLNGSSVLTFDKNAAADVVFGITMYDNEVDLVRMRTDSSDSKGVASSNYAVTADSFTIKKEFLSTLTSDTYIFTIVTLNGSTELTIRVIGTQEDSTSSGGNSAKGGCGSVISGAMMVISSLCACAYVFKKKKV